MNNEPSELKNQETLYDQNKMGDLNLLAEQDVHAMFTAEKTPSKNPDCKIQITAKKNVNLRSTALPLIHRGIYMHARGTRKGKPFCLLDVTTGKDLTFATADIDKLPESLRGTPLLVFRVTDVNEMDKNKLLYSTRRTAKDRANLEQFVKSYYQEEEEAYLKKHKRASYIKNDICQSIKPFGVKLLTNIFQHFKQMSRLENGLLTKGQFEAALKKFHVNISGQNFDIVWASTDRTENSKLNVGEFMRLFFGEMNENRKRWVFKAFSRVDPKKRGYGPIDEIKKFYNASQDPKVVKGELSEREAMNELLECFQHMKDKIDISFSEFEVYYEGLSLNYIDDARFIQQVRASWTI